MRVAVRAGFLILAMAVSAGLAQGQQSKAAQKMDHGKSSGARAAKQDFGPQSVPRRGDRMATVSPAGQGESHDSQTAGSAAGKTDKITFKQEFGPQQISRRGDRMTTATPGGQSGSHDSQPAGKTEKIKFKQEFGPSQGIKRQATVRRPPTEKRQKATTSK